MHPARRYTCGISRSSLRHLEGRDAMHATHTIFRVFTHENVGWLSHHLCTCNRFSTPPPTNIHAHVAASRPTQLADPLTESLKARTHAYTQGAAAPETTKRRHSRGTTLVKPSFASALQPGQRVRHSRRSWQWTDGGLGRLHSRSSGGCWWRPHPTGRHARDSCRGSRGPCMRRDGHSTSVPDG